MVMLSLGACLWISAEDQRDRLGLSTAQDPGHDATVADTDAVTAADAGIRMLALSAGSFEMGSDAAEADYDEQPVHTVTLTRDFWLGETEVTQDQWEAVTGATPSYHVGCGDCPVEEVSWADAALFANALSAAEGLDPCYEADGSDAVGDPYTCAGYRLPTEAEWEYAARAGEDYTYAGSDDADAVAWTSDTETHPVAGLAPNARGLYDTSGNVWEWTGDGYAFTYYATSPGTDPGGSSRPDRVLRGGSWNGSTELARVANRNSDAPSSRGDSLGLRLARSRP